MKTFVDNVAVFAVECCLLSDLNSIFSPSLVWKMSAENISGIAAEPEQHRLLREQNGKRIAILQAGLEICNGHVEWRSLSRNSKSSLSGASGLLTVERSRKGSGVTQ